jgi:hypothetical protein
MERVALRGGGFDDDDAFAGLAAEAAGKRDGEAVVRPG